MYFFACYNVNFNCIFFSFRFLNEFYYLQMQTMLLALILTVLLPFSIRCNEETYKGERLVVDALGRNFILGMLYDRRADRIITGQ